MKAKPNKKVLSKAKGGQVTVSKIVPIANGNAQNVKSLRDDLIEVYTALRRGDVRLHEAKEYANVAGKIMNSAKLQLDYNMFMKRSDSPIRFLQCNE